MADRWTAYRKQMDDKWTDGVQTHSEQLKITSDRMADVIYRTEHRQSLTYGMSQWTDLSINNEISINGQKDRHTEIFI